MKYFSLLGYLVVCMSECSTLLGNKRNICVLNSSCENGGTCRRNETTRLLICDCEPDFTGERCEIRLETDESGYITCKTDECVTSNPCRNGGTCIVDNSKCKATCQCTNNYTGDNCTQKTQTPVAPPCIDCHNPCFLDCGENGVCVLTSPPSCQCLDPFRPWPECLDVTEETPVVDNGQTESHTKSEESVTLQDEWKFWILGCSLVLLLVLGGFCVLIYTLLKKRNIFIMKFKYYFQPFEDDDGKEFDAFISYKSAPEDEAFVYRILYTELEVKRGYRLCLHHRDFTVGDRFPNVIGCVDGTLVKILAPSENEADYLSRKGFHSLNIQMICDATFRFINCVIKWPGSVHDSRIFRDSPVSVGFENGTYKGFLLGDSGYPCKPYLMTPFLTPSSRPEEKFNRSLCRTRVLIEQSFGILKRRFSCLHSGLRTTPKNSCKIISACVILHNIGIEKNDIVNCEPIELNENDCVQIQVGDERSGNNIRKRL